MPESATKKPLILCCGMQSSGSTLLSWCFLQRRDMDGVYDMENSVIHTDFSCITTPYVWVKMTIGSFRWLDVKDVYSDMGLNVKPLMLVRDTRWIFSSLMGKSYGINGIVAEEPPIRTRFRRFLQDWHHFRDRDYPIVKYEDLVADPVRTLQDLLPKLQLDWDQSMIDWKKTGGDISYMSRGNQSFLDSRNNANSLNKALKQDGNNRQLVIPGSELMWLEKTFRDFNEYHGYPLHLNVSENVTITNDRLGYSETTRVELQRKMDLTNRKAREMYEKYRDCNKKLDRIRHHVVLGRLLRFWSRYVSNSIDIR